MALPEVDVVIVGVGWVGGIIASELTKAGLNVVGLERGHDRGIADYQVKYDEIRGMGTRSDMFQNTALETWTLRHNPREAALPLRELGSFLPGTGVGGAGVHWSGQTWRFHPRDFTIRSSTVERYGPSFVPDTMSIQDWGITYDQLEPYYDKFEKMAGIAGNAGNLRGQSSPAGIRLKARARTSTRSPIPPCRTLRRSSRLRPRSSATRFSRSRPQPCLRCTPTRTVSPDSSATTAASAPAMAARWVPRPIPTSR